VSAIPRSVLIVDDSALNRLLVAATLRRDGYRILEAEDGASGLDTIERERPDLVILDFMMPGMDGAEMMRRLRARSGSSTPRILLMTALDAEQSAAKARELGANGHLIKPFAPFELRSRVKELLTGSSWNPKADANH
jgi:DNA-binding response OmpR family regulator